MESRTIPPAQASARQTEMGEKFNHTLFAALDAMEERNIPYALIGGIAASGLGRPRSTHDIDIFVRPEDAEAALQALDRKGFEIERTDPRWLFKGWMDDMMVDIIFKSSGDIYFDDEMYQRAKLIPYHGRNIRAVSPEDLVIIKAAVHSEVGPHHWHDALAILSHATLDWQYLLKRARRATRRILALLVYAQSNDIWIPNTVINDLYLNIFGETQKSAQQAKSYGGPSAAQTVPTTRTELRDQTVAPARSPHGSETYLIGHISEALAADPRTANLDCQLTVGGRKILIKGETQTGEQKKAIEEVVREFAPDFEVDTQLRVTEMSAPSAVEELV